MRPRWDGGFRFALPTLRSSGIEITNEGIDLVQQGPHFGNHRIPVQRLIQFHIAFFVAGLNGKDAVLIQRPKHLHVLAAIHENRQQASKLVGS